MQPTNPRGVGMRTRSGMAVAAIVALSASIIATPSASAEDTTPPVIHSIDVRPETIVLYKTSEMRVVVDVKITDDVGVTSATAWLWRNVSNYNGYIGLGPDLELVSGTPQSGTWRAVFSFDINASPGAWKAEAVAFDAAFNEAGSGFLDRFFVKRNTVISNFNVVEPVARGSYIRMSGRLFRLTVTYPRSGPLGSYVGYGNKTIHVLFRPTGATNWREQGTVTTTSLGYFTNSRSFRAWRDGAWRVRFDGTPSYLSGTSHVDYVDVR